MLSTEHRDWSFSLLDQFYQAGCTAFDTAHVYNDGASQRVLGEWMQSRGLGEKVVIINKAGHRDPHQLETELHEARERLQMDTIDLFIVHRDNPALSPEATVTDLNSYYQAGYVRAFGVSNWSHERIAAANRHAREQGLLPLQASSVQFSLVRWRHPPWEESLTVSGDNAALHWYQQTQMPLLAWSSLAGGFLSGKFRRDNLHTFTDYFDRITAESYGNEENFTRLDRARKFAAAKDITLPQLGLAYVLSQPAKTFAIVGCNTPSEFRENVHALNTTLTPNELHWLTNG